MKRKKLWVLGIIAVFLIVSAESCNHRRSQGQKDQQHAQDNEAAASARIQQNYEKSQPIPERPWSQMRQNLIEVRTAQMDGAQTTSFFFNQGVKDPVMTCPSIGFPIPSTTQLTNPEQKIVESLSDQDHGNVTLPQIEPQGVFSGDSSGTYVICVDATGKAYANYWEGFVQTVTGPATWDGKGVNLTGPPSFNFTEKK